jgi:hypothetical protein
MGAEAVTCNLGNGLFAKKKFEGLGIIDFQKHNAALLMKFLDKFYNKAEIPWVQLLWSEYYLVLFLMLKTSKVPSSGVMCSNK